MSQVTISLGGEASFDLPLTVFSTTVPPQEIKRVIEASFSDMVQKQGTAGHVFLQKAELATSDEYSINKQFNISETKIAFSTKVTVEGTNWEAGGDFFFEFEVDEAGTSLKLARSGTKGWGGKDTY